MVAEAVDRGAHRMRSPGGEAAVADLVRQIRSALHDIDDPSLRIGIEVGLIGMEQEHPEVQEDEVRKSIYAVLEHDFVAARGSAQLLAAGLSLSHEQLGGPPR